MNQSPLALTRSGAVLGAAFMVLAGIAFAVVNVATQWVAMVAGIPATSIAFWQYAFALVLSVPLLRRLGLRAMRTRFPGRHLARVLLAAFGVQAWVEGLATVPIWQAIALVMTSPFFIIVGAKLFLREEVGRKRWAATLTGFSGAMVILQPWSEAFTTASLLPVVAALLWGASSLLVKDLTAHERPETITIWLLVLLTPINAGLAAAAGFSVPTGSGLVVLVLAGLLTVLGQYFLTAAYKAADATYVQPFDDLKLPLNVLAGWIAFGYAPAGYLWVGAAMILGASLFLMASEFSKEKGRR